MHFWGDGFDFDRLERAGRQIEDIFNILTSSEESLKAGEPDGQHICWKEKYGILRFQMRHDWLYTYKWVDLEIPLETQYGTITQDYISDKDNRDEFLIALCMTLCDYTDMVKEITSDLLMGI